MNANARAGKGLALSTVFFALGTAASPATADHAQLAIGFGLGAQRAGLWVPPVYETRARTVAEPAVFENRTRRVWREPQYEERRVAVEIPADVIDRHVPRYDRWGNIIGVEHVREVVRPARTEWRVEHVLVREGRWETVTERVLVRPESTRIVYEQVLVRPGHWTSPPRHVISKDRDRNFAFHVGFRR